MSQTRRVALMLDLVWPFKRHARVHAGIEEYARLHNWKTIIDEFVDDTLPRTKAKPLPYDGVIARATNPLADRCRRLNLPLVNVWTNSPVWESLPCVLPDYEASGRMRAEHLLARGLQNFMAIGYHQNRDTKLEIDAFRHVFGAAGYSCPAIYVSRKYNSSRAGFRQAEQAIARAMDDWQLPIGVLACTEAIGRMVAQMCDLRGWRVPEDVAIIAGWNEEALCEAPRPSLTSMELGFERIGFEAAKMLDRFMDVRQKAGRRKKKGRKSPPQHIFLPPQGIVVRASTDFHAVDDDLVAAALEFISAQSHQPISPRDVARAVATEERTLRRRFTKFLGRPIAAEIRRVRIERAKRELAQTEHSIATVARNVGFGETLRLYEVFRRELGVTPSQYRKERQLDNRA